MKMPGLNRKVRIATDWLLHLLFPPELAQTKVAFEYGIRNQHFEPGDIIFQQGDLGDSVYVIEEGECEVLHEQNDEQELLATLNRGEYFGEMALLSDRIRNATIRARNATNVLIIPKQISTSYDRACRLSETSSASWSNDARWQQGHHIRLCSPACRPAAAATQSRSHLGERVRASARHAYRRLGRQLGPGGDLRALGRVSDDWRFRRCVPGETPGCAPSGGS